MNDNKIEVFMSAEFGQVRTLETDDRKVLFCGKDIASILGYINPRSAISNHCILEGVEKIDTLTNGGIQQLSFITEGNVYRLIAHSRKPNAERFEKWVFEEVLPTIRKHGAYQPQPQKQMTQAELILAMANNNVEMERRIKASEQAIANQQKQLDNMRDTMQIRSDNWRKLTHALVNRIAEATGNTQKDIYIDIYDELEYRAGCNLSVRYDHLLDRLRERGFSESKISRVNYVDVIANDRQLTEIYIAIVKEMAVKSGC